MCLWFKPRFMLLSQGCVQNVFDSCVLAPSSPSTLSQVVFAFSAFLVFSEDAKSVNSDYL